MKGDGPSVSDSFNVINGLVYATDVDNDDYDVPKNAAECDGYNKAQ